ncbi:MAG: UDP-3-O-(3-hydroxymyristoyl)glucosamine N-acyltransferase [SAR86 cluster bacterium]|jgi:UDP-3-O-[3-hydroxymyristoyl] glucosamine N-acyltransferase
MTFSISLGDLAQRYHLEFVGDPTIEVSGIANLRDAHSAQLAFLFSSVYRPMLNETAAAAVVMRKADSVGSDKPALISDQPRMVWALIAELFDPTPVPDRVIHPSAMVHPSVVVGRNVTIGANVVIEAGCHIGDAVSIGAGSVIGEGVSLGDQTRLFANVTLYHGVHVGRHCIVHSGAVIGADGFGFEFDKATATLKKIPQVYGVRIGDRVEIGAGTTIDRGALNDTLISDGVKLDNQIQVGHGTRIGANTAISGCTAIAGSTRIGAYCLIGGGVGIVDNIEIVDQVEITAMSLVSQSIMKKGRYSSGTSLLPGRDWKRSIVGFKRLDEILKRLRRLESGRSS